MNRDLWGNHRIRQGEYFVFHDESIPTKRWLLTGLTFVRRENLQKVREALHVPRQSENYYGEIHFSRLPKSFDGQFGAKARVARSWMQAFERGLSGVMHFSCLAVDRQSPSYEHRRFSQEFHAYNRFTAMALKAGISWHLGPENFDRLIIHFISDAKERASRPDQGMADNFEEYLPYRAELDSFLSRDEGNRYPDVHLELELEDSSKDDLLQFTDLLLGATQMALVAASKRPTKCALGEFIVRWCRDLQGPPWKQQFGLHRRFNLWAFPDDRRAPYNRVSLSLDVEDGQLPLFE